jgi:hypothetical protein
MYGDPALIRVHTVKLRLNEQENALVDALVDYTGQQKAALMRDLLLEQVRLALAESDDTALQKLAAEGA